MMFLCNASLAVLESVSRGKVFVEAVQKFWQRRVL